MKKIKFCIFMFFSLLLAQSVYAVSPLGLWKTIDDVTGQPKSILKIEKSENGDLYGQVIKIFPRPGYSQNEKCAACQGARHNQRIVGMIVLEGLKQSKDEPLLWNSGQILDPQNGKTYKCHVQVSSDGQQLKVRGYIGVPLFGRSQTWIRA